MSVRCCNKAHLDAIAAVHHHDSVAQVRLCNTVRTIESHEEVEYDDYCYDSQQDMTDDFGYERFLETRYSDEFRADEAREAAMGMVSFEEAYARAMA